MFLTAIVAALALWHPAPRASWQWQLSTPVSRPLAVSFYDVDLFDTDLATVRRLHARGIRVVCYISAGSYERWRPDARRFPAAVLGRPLAGWPGERWLDVRRLDVLGPIVRARLDLCKAKGFDAVEFDNVDGYSNRTGFPLAAADQLRYDRWLAGEAHRRGLSAALKNDLAQARALEPSFDWALAEECFRYEECGLLAPFTAAGKAVFDVEYELPLARFCPQARTLGIVAMRKRNDLGAWRDPCP